jgi:ligand-binding sensor domain-containing protein
VFSKNQGQLPSNSVTVLAADPDGSLWIGTPNGLTHYAHGRFRTFTQSDGLPANAVSSPLVDHADALWLIAGGMLEPI